MQKLSDEIQQMHDSGDYGPYALQGVAERIAELELAAAVLDAICTESMDVLVNQGSVCVNALRIHVDAATPAARRAALVRAVLGART